MSKKHTLEIIGSAAGLSVYLNNYRITGRATKPLGGGETIRKFTITDENLKMAMARDE